MWLQLFVVRQASDPKAPWDSGASGGGDCDVFASGCDNEAFRARDVNVAPRVPAADLGTLIGLLEDFGGFEFHAVVMVALWNLECGELLLDRVELSLEVCPSTIRIGVHRVLHREY
jgi:hypothetical protein